jgi:hypothetical protein
MKSILEKLKINEEYTKPPRLPKVFDSVKQNIPLKKHYNYMADLLMLPTTKQGYKYLLVVDDLATDNFDIEPIKNKEPNNILDAMKKMYKRPYIKEPYASVRTDGGNEFKGVFHKYLHDKDIIHKIAEPDRHKQLANVERLNKEIARLLNGYMNSKEEETDEPYKEWTDIIPDVRKLLNDFRKKDEQDLYTFEYNTATTKKPKYKVGDLVYHISEVPLDALKEKQPTKQFRVGDYRWNTLARKIVKVLPYPKNIRYILNYKPNVSYAEYELKPAREKEERFTIKEIISKRTLKNKTIEYKVWWRGFDKADATWEPKQQLIADGAKKYIDIYEGKA